MEEEQSIRAEVSSVLNEAMMWKSDSADIIVSHEQTLNTATFDKQRSDVLKAEITAAADARLAVRSEMFKLEQKLKGLTDKISDLSAERTLRRDSITYKRNNVGDMMLGKALAAQAMTYMKFSSEASFDTYTKALTDDERVNQIIKWRTTGCNLIHEATSVDDFNIKTWVKAVATRDLLGIIRNGQEMTTWAIAINKAKITDADYTLYENKSTSTSHEVEQATYAGVSQRVLLFNKEMKMLGICGYTEWLLVVAAFPSKIYAKDLYEPPLQVLTTEADGPINYAHKCVFGILSYMETKLTSKENAKQNALYVLDTIVKGMAHKDAVILLSFVHTGVWVTVGTEDDLPTTLAYEEWEEWWKKFQKVVKTKNEETQKKLWVDTPSEVDEVLQMYSGTMEKAFDISTTFMRQFCEGRVYPICSSPSDVYTFIKSYLASAMEKTGPMMVLNDKVPEYNKNYQDNIQPVLDMFNMQNGRLIATFITNNSDPNAATAQYAAVRHFLSESNERYLEYQKAIGKIASVDQTHKYSESSDNSLKNLLNKISERLNLEVLGDGANWKTYSDQVDSILKQLETRNQRTYTDMSIKAVVLSLINEKDNPSEYDKIDNWMIIDDVVRDKISTIIIKYIGSTPNDLVKSKSAAEDVVKAERDVLLRLLEELYLDEDKRESLKQTTNDTTKTKSKTEIENLTDDAIQLSLNNASTIIIGTLNDHITLDVLSDENTEKFIKDVTAKDTAKDTANVTGKVFFDKFTAFVKKNTDLGNVQILLNNSVAFLNSYENGISKKSVEEFVVLLNESISADQHNFILNQAKNNELKKQELEKAAAEEKFKLEKIAHLKSIDSMYLSAENLSKLSKEIKDISSNQQALDDAWNRVKTASKTDALEALRSRVQTCTDPAVTVSAETFDCLFESYINKSPGMKAIVDRFAFFPSGSEYGLDKIKVQQTLDKLQQYSIGVQTLIEQKADAVTKVRNLYMTQGPQDIDSFKNKIQSATSIDEIKTAVKSAHKKSYTDALNAVKLEIQELTTSDDGFKTLCDDVYKKLKQFENDGILQTQVDVTIRDFQTKVELLNTRMREDLITKHTNELTDNFADIDRLSKGAEKSNDLMLYQQLLDLANKALEHANVLCKFNDVQTGGVTVDCKDQIRANAYVTEFTNKIANIEDSVKAKDKLLERINYAVATIKVTIANIDHVHKYVDKMKIINDASEQLKQVLEEEKQLECRPDDCPSKGLDEELGKLRSEVESKEKRRLDLVTEVESIKASIGTDSSVAEYADNMKAIDAALARLEEVVKAEQPLNCGDDCPSKGFKDYIESIRTDVESKKDTLRLKLETEVNSILDGIVHVDQYDVKNYASNITVINGAIGRLNAVIEEEKVLNCGNDCPSKDVNAKLIEIKNNVQSKKDLRSKLETEVTSIKSIMAGVAPDDVDKYEDNMNVITGALNLIDTVEKREKEELNCNGEDCPSNGLRDILNTTKTNVETHYKNKELMKNYITESQRIIQSVADIKNDKGNEHDSKLDTIKALFTRLEDLRKQEKELQLTVDKRSSEGITRDLTTLQERIESDKRIFDIVKTYTPVVKKLIDLKLNKTMESTEIISMANVINSFLPDEFKALAEKDVTDEKLKDMAKQMQTTFVSKLKSGVEKSKASGKDACAIQIANEIENPRWDAEFSALHAMIDKSLKILDFLYPVRLIVNVRTGYATEAARKMAAEQWTHMADGGGDLKSVQSPENNRPSGPYYKVTQNGAGLPIAEDMTILLSVANKILSKETTKYKHYVYSAYGFSGSGKTTVLIFNDTPGGSPPVLQQVIDRIPKDKDWTIEAQIYDLYGEKYSTGQDDDKGCQKPLTDAYLRDNTKDPPNYYYPKDAPQYYRALALYSKDNITEGNAIGVTHVPMSSPLTNSFVMTSEDVSKLPQMINKLASEIKTKKNYGDNKISRYHVRMTPNNPVSSRAHMFVSLTLKSGDTVLGKITLIDMAGSEKVDIIQDNYFTKQKMNMKKMVVNMKPYPPADANSRNDNYVLKKYQIRLVGNSLGKYGKEISKPDYYKFVTNNTKDNITNFTAIYDGMTPTEIVGGVDRVLEGFMALTKQGVNSVTSGSEYSTQLTNLKGFDAFFKSSISPIINFELQSNIEFNECKVESWAKLLTTFPEDAGETRNMLVKVLKVPTYAVELSAIVRQLSITCMLLKLITSPNNPLSTRVSQSPLYAAASESNGVNAPKSLAYGIEKICESITNAQTELLKTYREFKNKLNNVIADYTKVQQQLKNDHPDVVSILESALDNKNLRLLTQTQVEEFADENKAEELVTAFKHWEVAAKERDDAIFYIHCPIRFQGSFIEETLRTDLKKFITDLQSGRARTETIWIDQLFARDAKNEDMKFIQIIALRADFSSASTDPQQASFKAGVIDSLELASALNPLQS